MAFPDFPRFIVFEGADGSGKTTQAGMLARHLASVTGTTPLCLREPTSGPWGTKIREAARNNTLPDPHQLVEWFIADRRENVEQRIRPALDAGRFVILDRYFYSTAAYQGAVGVPRAEILAANRAFAPEPDVCFVLFCDPEVAHQRIAVHRGQPLDAFEDLDFQCRVAEEYRQIVAEVTAQARCPMIPIDSTPSDVDAVFRQILAQYGSRIMEARRIV